MGFDDVMSKLFGKYYTESDFVEKTYAALNRFGFTSDNSIACVGICRDEIAQPLITLVREKWGNPFNLSSLAGMFFAGKTGLMAAMHHSPIVDGKERYVFYSFPHIAIDADGRIGVCKRTGRQGESAACGALVAFRKEISDSASRLTQTLITDTAFNDDIEYSLIKMRLLKEIPADHVPDLLELTKITQRVIQIDLENTLKKVVEADKNDYAIITGIQIHGPDGNYVSPTECYAVVNGTRQEIKI